jgi:hypothetical protein
MLEVRDNSRYTVIRLGRRELHRLQRLLGAVDHKRALDELSHPYSKINATTQDVEFIKNLSAKVEAARREESSFKWIK